jgi:hypothetical protein
MDEALANQIIQELGQLYGKYCDAFHGLDNYGEYFLKHINAAQKVCWDEITYQKVHHPDDSDEVNKKVKDWNDLA